MFQEPYFKFNGKTSKEMGVILVSTDEVIKQIGCNKEVKEGNTLGNIPTFYGVTKQCPTFSIQLSFVNKVDIPIIPTAQHRREVIEWLFPKDGQYKSFISEDNGLEYFIQFTKAEESTYFNGLLIKLEVKMNSPYAYTLEDKKRYYLTAFPKNKKERFFLENRSNVSEYYSPVFYFENQPYNEGSTFLEIKNITTGQTMRIENIRPTEFITINSNRRVVISNQGGSKYNDFTGDFVKMLYGMNEMEVQGNGVLEIVTRFPMLLE